MGYRLRFSSEAVYDIEKGIDYYNSQQHGLGKRFGAAVNATLKNIKKMPLAASIAYDNARYKIVDKFPYLVLYEVQGSIIFVARVFNTNQQSVY